MSDDGDDVVQAVFLKLIESQRAGTFPAVKRFGPYVSAMARNTALDLLRHRRRHLLVPLLPDDFAEEAAMDLIDHKELTALDSYLARLPTDLAAVFALRIVEGLTQARVCQELNISRQRLRTLERRLKNGAGRAIRKLQPKPMPSSSSRR
jgi:RNA polymerase sigma factor (sigma-70 family)